MGILNPSKIAGSQRSILTEYAGSQHKDLRTLAQGRKKKKNTENSLKHRTKNSQVLAA